MENPIKILVVEDDMIIAADISLTLSQAGYEVTGILPRGEAALDSIQADPPDLVLMDIALKGEWDGIATAEHVRKEFGIPIIFLTANSDKATFERAKATQPFAFLVKPFNGADLERAIELAISRLQGSAEDAAPAPKVATTSGEESEPFLLDDRIFVRHKDRMVKIFLKDILYIEAESNYSKIHTPGKEYLLAVTLKALGSRIKDSRFLRVHRSYIINLNKLEEVGELYLRVSGKQIPISKSHRETLFQRLKTI